MADKDPKSPATTSDAYDSMKPAWLKIQTVLDGTEAMRAAERRYLPQHHAEAQVSYDERLLRCTLLNISKLTLESWVGRPFSDPVVFEDVPPDIEEILEDVDQLGTDAQVFLRNWFSDGLAKSFSHVYIDMPRTDVDAPRTMADDKADNIRPYWVHINPSQIFFADSEVINGRETLREIRIMESVAERVGFAEATIPQIRRVFLAENEEGMTQGMVELYRLKDVKKEDEWVLFESYPFDLDEIPLVTFYSNRDDFMHGNPPLEDLVDLNIAHWQSTSDQRAVLTVARFPILALSGGTDDNNELAIGPNRWLYTPDAAAKFYYVEHSGAAIEAGRKDLLDLEEQMSEYGAEFLKKRPGTQTATARALDSDEATSPLQDMTLRFKHSVDRALDITAKWLSLENGGSAMISTEFGPEDVNQADLITLRETRKMRDISRTAYLEELIRRGLLDEEYDIEADATKLEQETMDMFSAMPDALQPEDSNDNVDGDTEGAQ